MNGYGEKIAKIIDRQVELDDDEDGLRTHLGASVLGHKCLRSVWLQFRWTGKEEIEGRILRLFERGHKAEEVFAKLLASTGAKIYTHDENGVQYRVSWWGAHLGGSMDGVACFLPELPPEIPHGAPVLLEMKTHNEKSFKALVKDGLIKSKPEHFKQAQLYMHGSGIKWCLYIAVNKNTDQIYCFLFNYDQTVGENLVNRAEVIIFSDGLPPRISDTPSWFECRFCKVADICFGYKMPFVNCRTCVHSKPQRDGTWTCAIGQTAITEKPKEGCERHVFNPDMFPHATPVDGSADHVTYQLRDGRVLTNGPGHIPSKDFSITC